MLDVVNKRVHIRHQFQNSFNSCQRFVSSPETSSEHTIKIANFFQSNVRSKPRPIKNSEDNKNFDLIKKCYQDNL